MSSCWSGPTATSGPWSTPIDRPIPIVISHGWCSPAERICEIANEVKADTIVVGNRGTRGSWWRVKDSVPNLVLRHAPCSVYIVDTRRAQ